VEVSSLGVVNKILLWWLHLGRESVWGDKAAYMAVQARISTLMSDEVKEQVRSKWKVSSLF
jgi:hypothetical protein